jgi:hypothetical protein
MRSRSAYESQQNGSAKSTPPKDPVLRSASKAPARQPLPTTSAHRGGHSARVSWAQAVQRGAGNRSVMRLLREVDDQSRNPSTGGDSEPGAVSSLQEDFVPAEYTAVPDQRIVTVLGPDEAEAAQNDSPNAAPTAPRVRFVDRGRTGTRRYGDPDDGPPLAARAFTNGGQTGTVVWSGGGAGGGAHGNEPAGSVQAQVAPVYEAAPAPAAAPAPTGAGAPPPPRFDGWVRAGTGTIAIVRSWVGIDPGNQGGKDYWVTPAAAARINHHETLHVATSSTLYTADLTPLETRIGSFRQGQPATRNLGPSDANAQDRVRTSVGWAAAITAFQDDDFLANQPGGTIDLVDLLSGTYPVDAGPGIVGGVAFTHRIRIPSEPNPA